MDNMQCFCPLSFSDVVFRRGTVHVPEDLVSVQKPTRAILEPSKSVNIENRGFELPVAIVTTLFSHGVLPSLQQARCFHLSTISEAFFGGKSVSVLSVS